MSKDGSPRPDPASRRSTKEGSKRTIVSCKGRGGEGSCRRNLPCWKLQDCDRDGNGGTSPALQPQGRQFPTCISDDDQEGRGGGVMQDYRPLHGAWGEVSCIEHPSLALNLGQVNDCMAAWRGTTLPCMCMQCQANGPVRAILSKSILHGICASVPNAATKRHT